MTTTAPSNALTVEDLGALPGDGRRYELIGGAIVMSLRGPNAVDGYAPYADARGPVTVDWPVAVSLEVAALARQ